MAKKVYFFTISLRQYEKEIDYCKLDNVLRDIIEKNAVKIGDVQVLDLTFEMDDMHTYLDIFKYKNGDYIFARATKQKPTGSMIAREYRTNKYDKLLDGKPEYEKGIEACSYMFCDLQKGVLAITAALGAPNEGCFERIFHKYLSEYDISLSAVPNPDGVERIYGKNKVEISQISIAVPIPDPVLLEGIFGAKGREIYNEVANGDVKAQVRLVSNVKKGKITNDTEDSIKLVDAIKSRLPLLSAASLRAKVTGEKTRDYNFYEENFYFPIDIKDYRIENGGKVYLDSDELVSAYAIAIRGAYNQSKGFILGVANRRD